MNGYGYIKWENCWFPAFFIIKLHITNQMCNMTTVASFWIKLNGLFIILMFTGARWTTEKKSNQLFETQIGIWRASFSKRFSFFAWTTFHVHVLHIQFFSLLTSIFARLSEFYFAFLKTQTNSTSTLMKMRWKISKDSW